MASDDNWFLNGKKVVKRQMLSKSTQQIINGVSIALEGSFGCLQSPIRRNAYFVSDDLMMFISGKHIVMYDIIRRRQSYIMKAAEDEQVQALNYCISFGKSLLIAMAFRSTSKILPTVKVYNRKKQRFYQLVHSHLLPNSSVYEVAFIGSGKYLVSLTYSDEGYGITIFQVTKEMTSAFHQLRDKKVTFIEIVNTSGPNYLTLFNFQSDIQVLDEEVNFIQLIPPVTLKPNEELIDCAVLTFDSIKIVLTSLNRCLIFKDKLFISITDIYIEDPMALKPILLREDGMSKEEKEKVRQQQIQYEQNMIKPKVSTISKTSKGFIIGLIGRPILEVFEVQREKVSLVFRGSYCIKDDNIYGIHQLHLASDEMYAALTVVYFNKSAYNVAKDREKEIALENGGEVEETASCDTILDHFQGKVELYTFNLAIVEALRSVQKDPFEPLFEKGVHRGIIMNIASTPMRSVIASVCEDKTCKFWDYSNDFRELFSHYFHETPNCVALHPLSFQCAIGFKEGMRLYYVLDDDLKLVHTESMKNCTAVVYSEGGHMLAASNSTQVCIFHPLKMRHLFNLPNHQSNLKELYFQDKDHFLVSICSLGVLYVWNLDNKDRAVDHALKNNKYNAVAYDSHYDLVIGACADQRIRVYTEKGQTLALEQDTSPTSFTCICISVRYNAIFFGTSQGAVRVYTYPFYHFNPKTMEYIEIPIHQASVTQIKLSPDNGYLITGSQDGSIFFSKIKQYMNGQELSQLDLLTMGEMGSKYTNMFALNPLSLCSKLNQDLRKENLKQLDYRLQNFKSDIDDAKEQLIISYNKQIKQLEDKNQNQLTNLREQLSGTIQFSDQSTNQMKTSITGQRKDDKQLALQLENEHENRLLQLYQERKEKEIYFSQLKEKQSQDKQLALKEYQSSLSQVDEEYLRKYQELYTRFSDAMTNMKQDQRKFKEVLQQGEKEYETFYQQSQMQLLDELNLENEKTQKLRSSIAKFTKENERLQHRRDFLNGLVKDTENQVSNLTTELTNYIEKHHNMISQLGEKEDLINQREQQIKDFRMKNVHLQNFQKVYDYRVNTLKDEREPLMDHLKNMDKHVKNLYNELIEEAAIKQKHESNKGSVQNTVDDLKAKLKDSFNQANISKRKIEVYEFEISKILQSHTDTWYKSLVELHKSLQIENKKNFRIKGSIFSETMKDMQKDPQQAIVEKNMQESIQKELSSQKNFLKKKLGSVQSNVKHSLEERHQAYYSIQSTNTRLIKECNDLRDTKQRLKDHIEKQTKAFREVRRELHTMGHDIPEDLEQIIVSEEEEQIEPNQETLQDQEPDQSVEREQQFQQTEQIQTRLMREQSKKTPFAQHEEQKNRYNLLFQQLQIRRLQVQSVDQNTKNLQKSDSSRLFNELIFQFKGNSVVEEISLQDRLRQKTHQYLKQSESQLVLPSVTSFGMNRVQLNKPKVKISSEEVQGFDFRQQLLSAGQTVTRGSKNSTNTNFFVQTHTSAFTQKTKTPNPFGKKKGAERNKK